MFGILLLISSVVREGGCVVCKGCVVEGCGF